MPDVKAIILQSLDDLEHQIFAEKSWVRGNIGGFIEAMSDRLRLLKNNDLAFRSKYKLPHCGCSLEQIENQGRGVEGWRQRCKETEDHQNQRGLDRNLEHDPHE